MCKVFESSEAEAVILVDSFNSLNRQVALHNISHLCPPLSKGLIDTYWEDVQLFIDGETLLSQEGTTQGDPLAGILCHLNHPTYSFSAILSLIHI